MASERRKRAKISQLFLEWNAGNEGTFAELLRLMSRESVTWRNRARLVGGLTIAGIVEMLEISTVTVSRPWASAKAGLCGELTGSRGGAR